MLLHSKLLLHADVTLALHGLAGHGRLSFQSSASGQTHTPPRLVCLACSAITVWCSAGADCRSEDFQGNTPAHIAASTGHLQLLSHLLKVVSPPLLFRLSLCFYTPAHWHSTVTGRSVADLERLCHKLLSISIKHTHMPFF